MDISLFSGKPVLPIGLPKEIKTDERRVALIPGDCEKIIARGAEIFFEKGAGEGSGFSDEAYLAAGAVLAKDAAEIYERARLIVKVKEPQPSELSFLRSHHTLFCFLHLGGNPELTAELLQIGLTGYAFETFNIEGKTALLSPMSSIAGRLSIFNGAHYLQPICGGRGTLLGGIGLSHGIGDQNGGVVTILGAGVAGYAALDLALATGARVHIFDLLPSKIDALRKSHPKAHSFVNTPDDVSCRDRLCEVLEESDLLVGAVYVPGKRAPVVVDREMMALMPRGSVAFDIAVDQGGCFATTRPCTHSEPTYIAEGVIHSAVTNLPAAAPRSASVALSGVITPYALALSCAPDPESDPVIQSGLNLAGGKLVIAL